MYSKYNFLEAWIWWIFLVSQRKINKIFSRIILRMWGKNKNDMSLERDENEDLNQASYKKFQEIINHNAE